MSRLTLKMVCSGSDSARSRAAVPTRTVPSSWKLRQLGTRATPGGVADDDGAAVLDVGREAERGAEVDADDGGGHGVIRIVNVQGDTT